MRMMQEGRNMEDMQKLDYLSYAVLPDLGRSEEQRPPQGRFALHVRWPVQFRDGARKAGLLCPLRSGALAQPEAHRRNV